MFGCSKRYLELFRGAKEETNLELFRGDKNNNVVQSKWFSENSVEYSPLRNVFRGDFSLGLDIHVEEYKTIKNCLNFSTKDDSNKDIYIMISLPDVVFVSADTFRLNDADPPNDAEEDLFKMLDYFFYKKPSNDKRKTNQVREKLLNQEILYPSDNNEIYYFHKTQAAHFKEMFSVFGFDENMQVLNSVQQIVECECVFVKQNLLSGWGLYIHIYGEKCLNFKYLKFDFRRRDNKNFLFKKAEFINNFYFFDEIQDIWMKRETKDISEELFDISEELFDISEELFDISEESSKAKPGSQWIKNEKKIDVFKLYDLSKLLDE